jgi:uncharacterized OB-fold protein
MSSDATRPPKPVPIVQPWAQPFWDATRQIHYPRIACPYCGADDLGWREASGRGTIYSYTVVESNAPSAFIGDMPYVVAVIRLAEGVQMLSNVVECEPGELRCDQPVEVVFGRMDDAFTLPKFRPVR